MTAGLLVAPVELSAQITSRRSRAQDFYRVKSALLPRRKTFDFRLTTSYQTVQNRFRVPLSVVDTLVVAGRSQLGNMAWALSYAWNNNWETSISGMSYYDAHDGTYRYGAGDTRIGLRYTAPNLETEYNFGFEAFYSLPTGFNEGERLVRAFASKSGSWGGNFYTDFQWTHYSVKVNGGYYHAGGKYKRITNPLNTFWYHTLNGINGITPKGQLIQSSQAYVGIGLSRNFFMGTRLFGEYVSHTVFTREGDGKSLGNVAAGLSLYNRGGIDLKIGADIPLGEIRPNKGFFLDVRLNGIIGGRRIVIPIEPIVAEEEPALSFGRKPFFRREGIIYSRVRDPVHDTVIIIDGTPSMLGRSTLEGNRGEDVVKNVIDFAQTLIDSTSEGSNISLISYSDVVSSLSWRSIDDLKKEEVKNSLRDVPDDMNQKADELENRDAAMPWREMLQEAIVHAYEELAVFKRSDYNRIHLQRIIVFSDGIDESTMPKKLEPGFNNISRRYQVTRNDFRYFYYIHTNPKSEGAKIDESIIKFGEKENGKTFRSTDIANIGEEFMGELDYNGIEQRSTLRYQSQITKMAVLDFNTKGLGNFGAPLVDAFKSVFDNNEYFVLSPQMDVEAVLSNEGLVPNQQYELSDILRVGRRLGVDYVVYGEIVKYEITRGKGIFVPFLVGFPRTEMYIEVAIRLIDIAEGTLSYVSTISAKISRSDGITAFPRTRENKMNQLSGVQFTELQRKLMESWAKKLRESMFEDRTIVVS